MKMRIFQDEQILDLGFRKKVIEEILGPENICRKNEALRRYEVYRDKTVKWVLEKLKKEGLKASTLQLMENRAANVSICRKIVNKLARVYNGGVQRLALNPADQPKIDELAKMLSLNIKMKKSDKFRELQKNTLLQVIPELDAIHSIDDQKKFNLKVRNYQPWQYDAIEDYYDHERPRCFVLTDFVERNRGYGYVLPDDLGKHVAGDGSFDGNGHDEVIADNPADQGSSCRTFIWWTNKYHLTTDSKGAIISEMTPEQAINPIQMLPFVNITADQDGEFWAQGGNDLVDSTILINMLLTDMNAIQYMQGWGQLVVTGKELPNSLQGGPHQAILLEYQDGDPKPDFDFKSANPPIDMWMKAIEQYTALVLTTNDLSPRNIAGSLNAQDLPSGIALLVEQSEATGAVEDKQVIFQDAEHDLWEVIGAWQNMLFDMDALTQEFMEIGKLDNPEVIVKFNSPKPMFSEKEKLETIQLRKDLGINEKVDLIMIDNPDMSRQDAEDKIKRIQEERLGQVSSMIASAVNQVQPEEPNPEAMLNGA